MTGSSSASPSGRNPTPSQIQRCPNTLPYYITKQNRNLNVFCLQEAVLHWPELKRCFWELPSGPETMLVLVLRHPPLSIHPPTLDSLCPSAQCPMHPVNGQGPPLKAGFFSPFLAHLFINTTCPMSQNLPGISKLTCFY